MTKLLVSLLSMFVFVCFVLQVPAQVRPRRVGKTQGEATAAPSNPETTTPTRPPVLGGSNRPTGQQQPTPQAPVQTGPEEVDAGDIIKVNTTLVTIPVSVMDRDGRYVPNLNKSDFRIWEDGAEQEVAFFASVEKPFSVFLVLDTSPSTKFRLEDIQDAAIAFVNQLRSDDKVMVVSFNNDIKVLSELTTDRTKLQRAIMKARTDNGTRLYDTMDMLMNQYMNRVQGRKAIVLFTDGVDTTSRYADYRSTALDAEELDALIYPVRYDTQMDIMGGYPQLPPDVWGQILGGIFGGGRRRGGGGGGGNWPNRGDDYGLAQQYLRQLATTTGGRMYDADTTQNMSYAFANVAEELRRQYSLGYYPKRQPQPGERRQIRVRTNQMNLAVRARDSYVFKSSGAVVDAGSQPANAPVLKRQ
ncbi:MAG TPA: VWA domain-containing protein [Pyrinomonadaceae bacterium]